MPALSNILSKYYWPIVYYNQDLNILVPTVYKNGSSAIEMWLEKRPGWIIVDQSYKETISERQPSIVTLIRDPIERAISAINMLQIQYKRYGVNVTWENFTNVHISFEPHIMPQSAQIFTYTELPDHDYDIMWDSNRNKFQDWNHILYDYGLISRLSHKNLFFYITEGKDVIKDLCDYFNISLDDDYEGHNSGMIWGPKPTVTQEYKSYLRTVYDYDYKLVNYIKFENGRN